MERLVGAEVRPGEWHLVLLFFANLFLLLAAYYILKVIREPLILLEGGAVERSYARGLQAVLLLLLVPAYGLLANRFEPAKLVKWIMGVFVLCVGVFVFLGQLGVHVGFAFFVWLGIFSTVAIAQFWSLATDVMTEAEGKRLFPMVAAGGTLGGIFGAQIAARLIDGHPHQLMLVAASILVSCALLTHMTHDAASAHRIRVPAGPLQERDARGGFSLVLHDRYLLLIALSVLILNFVNTTGDFVLAQLVNAKAHTLPLAARQHYITAFYGNFQTLISVLTSVVQILVVARVFKVIGIGSSLLFLPVFALAGYATSAFLPLLGLVATVKVVENSTDYSLQNTVQQALFLPTSRDAKYKAKAAIDTLFVRLGDLGSTAVVFVGAMLGFGVAHYALVNLALSAAWIVVAVKLRKTTLRSKPEPPKAEPAAPEPAAQL
ncbi:MAG TPA: Npt1/Npt2 family nucleotide transporter [Polyangiaceae bacterium]|nr:Npt1/Npt2 family nucleotide transporter [Polyangiaceae bacterium]